MNRHHSRSWALAIVLLQIVAAADAAAADPRAIPTFHCLGLYWSPPGGAADKQVQVRYRPQGTQDWHEAFPMRYLPIPGTDEDLADYRGSIVHLAPGTTYEVQLTLAGTPTAARITATTWSERFPVARTRNIAARQEPLVITESGTAGGYLVYDGHGARIDVRHRHDACITVDASHVILRGFTLKGAGDANRHGRGIVGAIHILRGHDIVIEDCDISDWGRLNPKTGFGYDIDSAILARRPEIQRLVVQRCKLHHPTFDGSNWHEPVHPTHSMGPQCISLFNTDGNHVIRYNECTSDLTHMYNDIIGGGSNGSFRGAPGPDSDIYGNLVSHCWDDGLEVEGGNRNTRVWGNYITQTMMGIGNAATSIGPLYIWNNVVGRSQTQPDKGGAFFLKMGYATSEDWMTGSQYIFHNTIFAEGDWLCTGGLGGKRIVKHTTSRNNILHVRSSEGYSASQNAHNLDNDFDFDLYNGRVPPGQESHGVRGTPVYAAGAGFEPKTSSGQFQLADTSPGAGAATPIPNFSQCRRGAKPDMGAHQRQSPRMQFGGAAGRNY